MTFGRATIVSMVNARTPPISHVLTMLKLERQQFDKIQ